MNSVSSHVRIKVLHGTPRHDESLCDDCTNARWRRGVRLSDEWHECEEFKGPIHQPVVECNKYWSTRLNVPAEMSQQAFRWVPSLGKFLTPVEWERARHDGKLTPSEY